MKAPSGCLRRLVQQMCALFVFRLGLLGMVLAGMATGVGAADSPSPAKASRPNVVFILADDLGYGDLGCYGQTKIRTPNLDRMAAEGIRFTAHYAGNNVCAPSRCVLLSGKHPGHAYIRDNRDKTKEGLEGQEPVPAGELLLPLGLKQLGYQLGAFGKWGLGPVGSTGEGPERTACRVGSLPDSGAGPNRWAFGWAPGREVNELTALRFGWK